MCTRDGDDERKGAEKVLLDVEDVGERERHVAQKGREGAEEEGRRDDDDGVLQLGDGRGVRPSLHGVARDQVRGELDRDADGHEEAGGGDHVEVHEAWSVKSEEASFWGGGGREEGPEHGWRQ